MWHSWDPYVSTNLFFFLFTHIPHFLFSLLADEQQRKTTTRTSIATATTSMTAPTTSARVISPEAWVHSHGPLLFPAVPSVSSRGPSIGGSRQTQVPTSPPTPWLVGVEKGCGCPSDAVKEKEQIKERSGRKTMKVGPTAFLFSIGHSMTCGSHGFS